MTINNTYESDPNLADIQAADLSLTKQEWQILVGALTLLASDARGSDRDVVRKLAVRLEEHRDAHGVVICI